MKRIQSALGACLALILLLPTAVLGQHGMEEEIPSKDSWVVPYALVVLCVGLGVYIIAKPAREKGSRKYMNSANGLSTMGNTSSNRKRAKQPPWGDGSAPRLQFRLLFNSATLPIGLAVFSALVSVAPLKADEPDWQAVREQIMSRGADYLAKSGSAENGSFSQSADPGVTALCTTALLRSGRSPDDPVVQRSLTYLETFVQPDGGIYRAGAFYQNYETSIAMLAFNEANADGRYDELLRNAATFTRQLQWDEDEGKDPSDPSYGGAGYGSHKRPDLSNTQFFIEALKSQESEENQEAIERALIFVSRSQNLESPHNTLAFAAKIQDGGFYYTPAAGGSSPAGTTEDGGLRSYGSMTYAGLKSMIHAGVGPDDPRVQAAVKWIQQNYSVDENPGMGDNGLFYYFHTFAKALDAIGKPELQVANGDRHDWRQDLTLKLAAIQQPDGSWVNQNERWLEGDPKLATAFALLALSHCQ